MGPGAAINGQGISESGPPSDPDALCAGIDRWADRWATGRAVPRPGRARQGGRLRGAGPEARADGAGGLSPDAPRVGRRGGRLPGGLPRPGAEGGGGPGGRGAEILAPRGGRPGGEGGPEGGGETAGEGAAVGDRREQGRARAG